MEQLFGILRNYGKTVKFSHRNKSLSVNCGGFLSRGLRKVNIQIPENPSEIIEHFEQHEFVSEIAYHEVRAGDFIFSKLQPFKSGATRNHMAMITPENTLIHNTRKHVIESNWEQYNKRFPNNGRYFRLENLDKIMEKYNERNRFRRSKGIHTRQP